MSKKESHGLRDSRTYSIWCEMKKRCYNEKHASYRWYGAKGVTVDAEWKNSFLAFYRDMGACPDGMSIDRINPDLGYSKANCRWATPREQTHNRKVQEFYTHEGVSLTLPEWADKLGVKYRTLLSRMRRTGLSFSEAITHKFGTLSRSGAEAIKQAVTQSNIRRGLK